MAERLSVKEDVASSSLASGARLPEAKLIF
jgi:hypothetical protein